MRDTGQFSMLPGWFLCGGKALEREENSVPLLVENGINRLNYG
jgi:hypothetical protein